MNGTPLATLLAELKGNLMKTSINLNRLVMGSVLATSLLVSGCATKKFVRKTIDPTNAKVDGLEKKTADQAAEIDSINGNLSKTREQVGEVDRKATEANSAAARANENATDAGKRADGALNAAKTADSRAAEVARALEMSQSYKEMTTSQVFFRTNSSTLSKEAEASLDELVGKIGTQKAYVIEVLGFTDKTGSKTLNQELAQRRAQAVVRYLSSKDVPLRSIHVLGIGAAEMEAAEGMTRADVRKQSRRVDLKVLVPGNL
jgi:OmpA-OmpF porin, OOP family